MTSVIRVKRRIDEDPAEALHLSCKRQRHSTPQNVESVLSFAGTLKSKNEPVSSHIHEAIRKNKAHKDLHPHSSDFKHAQHKSNVTSKLRHEKEETSRKNRYRITWSRRALELTELDKEDSSDGSSDGLSDKLPLANSEQEAKGTSQNTIVYNGATRNSNNNKENLKTGQQCPTHISVICPEASGGCLSTTQNSDRASASLPSRHLNNATFEEVQGSEKTVLKEDKMFCIFDVESEEENDLFEQAKKATRSGITVNNVPMVSTPAPLAESEYVYDLYYTHNSLCNLDLDAVLTVQGLCEDLVHDDSRRNEGDLVYDDDNDDSNDEGNWRNDYPDEDPHFFENENVDYDYSEGMLDSNVLDDEGDLLAYWMNTKCKVDLDSDDAADEYAGDKKSSDSDNIDY